MQLRQLGPNGPLVGAIGLGINPLASFTDRPSLQDAIRVLVHSAELGVTLWDTADAYCLDDTDIGYGEWLPADAVAELPADLREQVIIATKGGTVRPQGGWEQDGSPAHLEKAIEASLKALRTERIDLYQLHAPDKKVPFADSIGALAKAQQQGKIRLIGLSNVSVEKIEEALEIAPIASVQNSYGLGYPGPERDKVLNKCRELGLAFLAHSPFGGVHGAKKIGETEVLRAVAQELEVSPYQVTLAWMMKKYDRLIPIPGVSRIASMEDCARADSLILTDEQQARLENATN